MKVFPQDEQDEAIKGSDAEESSGLEGCVPINVPGISGTLLRFCAASQCYPSKTRANYACSNSHVVLGGHGMLRTLTTPHIGDESVWLHYPRPLEVPKMGRKQYGRINPAVVPHGSRGHAIRDILSSLCGTCGGPRLLLIGSKWLTATCWIT